jgi:hypothetical protein
MKGDYYQNQAKSQAIAEIMQYLYIKFIWLRYSENLKENQSK